jgi:hypothetical protein
MVKFIDYWMFASRLWNDAESTAVVINLREVQQIGQISVESLGGDIVAIYLKNNREPIPIEGDIVEILAEFQKHLNTIYI